MSKTLLRESITIHQLEREMESLRKKIFIYETLNAEKEIEKNKIKGPFKSGREVLNHIKK